MPKNEMFYMIVSAAVVCIFVFALAHGLSIAVDDHQQEIENYKSACLESNGSPQFNGKYWECLR